VLNVDYVRKTVNTKVLTLNEDLLGEWLSSGLEER
jgi:hypothetical protein